MIERLRFYDTYPKLDRETFPERPEAQKEKRETFVSRDQWNDIHIKQIKDGVSNIISLDRKELYYILSSIRCLTGE